MSQALDGTQEDRHCAFCAIVAGEAEASIVYEDAAVLAFVDIRPATRGHLLVIPRLHVPYLSWTEEFLAAKVFGVAQQLTTALRRSALDCAGVNLFLAEGAAAGQEVEHVHIHVIPRFADDGFGLNARFSNPARAELDEVATIVRSALEPEAIPED